MFMTIKLYLMSSAYSTTYTHSFIHSQGITINYVHERDMMLRQKNLNLIEGLPEPRSVFVSLSVGPSHIIFGGETSPSNKGHSGAGNFTNSLIVLDEADGGQTVKKADLGHEPDLGPSPRGWLAGAALQDNRFAIFGGLSGDDESPIRLDDLWICKLNETD